MAPKSILKVKDIHEGSILSSVAGSKEDRNRELALHHATLIQDQKDVRDEVFKSMLNLIDLPNSLSATPENPSDADGSSFIQDLKLFQPSDFDELIEERHANGKCGYALCPRPYKKQSTTAKFRILGKSNVNDMKIVSKDSLERWCSEACARRAMYVKVQLSDEPPWLRMNNAQIKLMPEQDHSLAFRPKPVLHGDKEDILQDHMNKLRLERDDKTTSARVKHVMNEDVLERDTIEPADEPRLDIGASNMVEGYQPKASKQHSARSDVTQSDDGDNDWEI